MAAGAAKPREILSEDRGDLRGLSYRFISERVTVPTRWSFREPHHTFVVHRSGRLRMLRFEYDHGPHGSLALSPGDVWVIPAGGRCDAVLQGDSIEFVEIAAPARALGLGEVRAGIGFSDPFLYESLRRLHTLMVRVDVNGLLMRESLGEAVRLHLRDQYVLGRSEAGSAPRRLTVRTRRLLVAHLEDELASDITLDRLAGLAGMPVGAFVTAFTAAFGVTPYQYVLDRRIEVARKLLATTDTPIRSVGESVGFSTPSHFASTFRQRVGVTPTQYRAASGRS